MNSSFERSRSITWQKLGLSILCAVLAIVLILLIFATVFIHDLIGKISHDGGEHIDGTLSSSELDHFWETRDDTLPPDYTHPTDANGETIVPTEPTLETHPNEVINNENVISILLIGQDRYPGQTGNQRSDSMILCSFNLKTKEISMISFLRDTYVTIPGYRNDKINAAYALGGMKALTNTLATNFGVHVDGCVEVDFNGFTTIINMLGGVDINLTQKEADHLNTTSGFSLTPGVNHLNGDEALAYARIRKIDMDAKRAERQRKVLTALINAYKNRPVWEMVSLASDILDTKCVRTNMSQSDIIDYVGSLFPMLSSSKISSHQIPVSGSYEEVKAIGNIVDLKVVVNMEINRALLEKLLG